MGESHSGTSAAHAIETSIVKKLSRYPTPRSRAARKVRLILGKLVRMVSTLRFSETGSPPALATLCVSFCSTSPFTSPCWG